MWLGVLGPLSIRHEGSVIAVSAARQRTVLAVLLVHANRVVSADELVDTLWEGSPPATARVTLRGYIKRLRQLLGPAVGSRIITCAPGYAAEFGSGELDLLRFADLCREGGAALHAGAWRQASDTLGEALGLWRDTALSDVPCERLQREEVPRLDQMRVQAAEWRAEAELHLGRHDQLVPDLRNLVEEQPLRERFHAQLMIALNQCGRQAEALAAYQQARRVLADELGVEPGMELQRLQRRILQADPDLVGTPPTQGENHPTIPRHAQVVPRQLPPSIQPFIGRARELKTLTKLLEDVGGDGGTVVVSAICGTAGVGKTALAVHWAHHAAHHFSDGQLYVDLRGFDPSRDPVTPGEAIESFLDALGIPADRIAAGAEPRAALYRSLMAGHRMLIVLDNARDSAQVRPLLPGTAGCLVIVTSRTHLRGLAAAQGARLIALDVLTDADSRDLLASRLGADRIAAESTAATELAKLCAHLPLALAVAATRAADRPDHTLGELAAELADASARLDTLETGESVADVRTVLSWSYRQLSDQAAQMFRLLGIHPGPDLTAAAAASLAGFPLQGARRALNELASGHLLAEHPSGRYAFHDLLRAYAAECACSEDEAERRTAIHRMLDHYLHTAHAAALLLNPSREPITLISARPGVTPESLAGHQQAAAWFEAEHHVLLSATTLAAEGGFDTCAWQPPWTMTTFLYGRGHWHEQAASQRIALAAASRLGDKAGQAAARRAIAHACAMLGDYDDARAYLADCPRLYRHLGDHAGEARVHQSLSWVFAQQDRHADALRHAKQALRLFEAIADRAGQAAARNAVGWYHLRLGDPQRARMFCQQALALHRELGDRNGEAATWDSLGYADHQLGRLTSAAACYRQAIILFRELGDRVHEAETLTHLGDTRLAAGDPQEAQDTWRQALDIRDDLHHPDAELVRDKLKHLGVVARQEPS
jgi:DNA-binding SARP family transcriptional activator